MEKIPPFLVERSATIGYRVQEEFPVVMQLYKQGQSHFEIARQLNFPDYFGVDLATCARSVCHAIRGYGGSDKVEAYEGLIAEKEELEKICRDHKSKPKRPKQLDPVEVGRKRAESRGQVPWLRREELGDERISEVNRAIELSQDPRYFHTKKSNLIGTPNYREIARQLFSEYPESRNQRSSNAVRTAVFKATRRTNTQV